MRAARVPRVPRQREQLEELLEVQRLLVARHVDEPRKLEAREALLRRGHVPREVQGLAVLLDHDGLAEAVRGEVRHVRAVGLRDEQARRAQGGHFCVARLDILRLAAVLVKLHAEPVVHARVRPDAQRAEPRPHGPLRSPPPIPTRPGRG